MATVLLIRHAEHEIGPAVLVGRRGGVRLSNAGVQQAVGLAGRLADLPIAAIYASPLERTVQTAEIIAERHGLPVETREALLEVDFGSWTGMSFEQLRQREDWKRWNAMRSVSAAPEGEFMLEAQRRAVQCVAELVAAHESQCIAAVSHGDIIRSLAAHYLGVHLDLFLRIEVSLASVTVLRVEQDRVRMVCVNNTGDVRLEA